MPQSVAATGVATIFEKMERDVGFVEVRGGRLGFAGINRVLRAAWVAFDTEAQRHRGTEEDRKMGDRKMLTRGRGGEPRMTRMARMERAGKIKTQRARRAPRREGSRRDKREGVATDETRMKHG